MNAPLTPTAVAVNRLGLGVRPDEPLPPPADAQRWLLAQFEKYEARPGAWASQPRSGAMVTYYVDYLRELRQADAATEQMKRAKLRQEGTAIYRAAVEARAEVALNSPAPFAERLVHFWANHFAVSTEKPPLFTLAGTFEGEAIRPNVFGKFEDLLMAVEKHPAMLLYLDQVRSIGPDSAVAVRAARMNPDRQRGMNENLAREILELHTQGVRSGYTQQDVTELARALTGFSVAGLPGLPPVGTPGEYAYNGMLHQPGTRTVLGKAEVQQAVASKLTVTPAFVGASAMDKQLRESITHWRDVIRRSGYRATGN